MNTPSKEEHKAKLNLVEFTEEQIEENRTDANRSDHPLDYDSFSKCAFFRDDRNRKYFLKTNYLELFEFASNFFKEVYGTERAEWRWDMAAENYQEVLSVEQLKSKLMEVYGWSGEVVPETRLLNLLQRLWDHQKTINNK